jgi:excinuclease UvrABC ATPase subunit
VVRRHPPRADARPDRVEPSIFTQRTDIVCPVCGASMEDPSAESFSFNSYGACPACQGLGVRSEVDVSTLVPDPTKTIADGAVLQWNSGGRRLSMYAAGELGVRLEVPYQSLTHSLDRRTGQLAKQWRRTRQHGWQTCASKRRSRSRVGQVCGVSVAIGI